MRFQTKMIVTYTVFILLVGVVIALAYYGYSVDRYVETEEKNLEVAAQQVVNQINELIKPMETRTRYILSDSEILDSIRLLSVAPQSDIDEAYLYDARDTILRGINIDYVMNDFYRVVLFNPGGDVVSSRTPPPLATRSVAEFEEMPWLAEADATKGKPVLISAHEDTWGVQSRPRVFSLLRAIQGSNMGYIEVQRTVESVADAITLPGENMEVLIFVNDGELLYAGGTAAQPAAYWAALAADGAAPVFRAEVEGAGKLVATGRSAAYDVTVLVAESMAHVQAGSNSVAPITVGIAIIFCVISLVFVLVASRLLTKPLRQLREVMEHTRLDNLAQERRVAMPNDELEALSLSYQNVLGRLRESIVKEKQASLLQVQAQFDLLQAQVNPHFLYNVLNVIAQRGLKNGDEEICDLCASLASMLRYSTNTKQRYATIAQELEYLGQYFYLLKSRYEHKISFAVEVDAEIHGQVIPKIVLQQVVENSINHGFANSTDHMHVRITGAREGERWIITVRDNGQGFAPGKLEEIGAQLAEAKARIAQERSAVELEIGGMGLVNTYARLYLLFGDSLDFTLHNCEDGAEVLLSATWNEEGMDDVPDHGG
uniref:Putative sensor histidine-kinase response regulator n=1 Tax=termite gut metagenome TaxID=433724 RepID=S0DGQ1_9ZZZZ